MSDNSVFGTRCSSCFSEISAPYKELEKDNNLACPGCGAVNVIDIEKFLLQRQAIINKALGKRPADPDKN